MMRGLSGGVDPKWHDGPGPLAEQIALCAGPLALTLEAGDLRCIHLGSREIVRRIYGAVRDRHWNTVPPGLSQLSVETGDDHFRVTYRSDHREGDIDFSWQADIDGGADGTIRFRFDGAARSTFLRNRIGLCVLHPIQGVAGHRARATTVDGVVRDLVFPVNVAVEQPIAGFHDLAALAHEVEPGLWAEVTFEGDVFETEDQRNWIDASYKTYSTPLSLPLPVEVLAGTRVVQEVTVRLRPVDKRSLVGPMSRPVGERSRTGAGGLVIIEAADGPTRALPPIGLQMSREPRPLTPADVDALRVARLAHLRVDLRLAQSSWRDQLALAGREIRQLGCALELAVHLPADAEDALDAMGEALGDDPRVARLLVFTDGRATTAPGSLEAVRQWMRRRGWAGAIPVGTGTTGDLYRINLQRPPLADLLCWSMNPQVHAVDVTSIAETPEGARDQVESMKHAVNGVGLVASPITLRPGGQPDERQRSHFAAGWTLAMAGALAAAGVDSLTFFETIGPAGLMDDDGLFPMFHVFAALASAGDASVVPTTSSDDNVAPVWLTGKGEQTLLLANLSRHARTVRLPAPFHGGRLARLDVDAGEGIGHNPTAFARPSQSFHGSEVTLMPFGLARVEGTRGS